MTTFHDQPMGSEFEVTSILDDPHRDDLDATSRPFRGGSIASARIAEARMVPDLLLEASMQTELAVGGRAALDVFAAFCRNTVPGRVHRFDSLDHAVRDTPGFVTAARRFELALNIHLEAQYRLGAVDYRDLVTGSGPRRGERDDIPPLEPGAFSGRMLPSLAPPRIRFELEADRVVKICFGSIQGVRVHVHSFRATDSPPSYEVMVHYQLRDHFGVNDSDCEIDGGFHGTPGQIAMWVLQHDRPPGHKPMILVADVVRRVRGSLY